MKQLLLITEDVVKVQTLTKFLGRLYSRLYIVWLAFRLKITIFCLRPFYSVTVVGSDGVGYSGKDFLSYGDLLSQADYAKRRSAYWEITTQLAEKFSYQYKGIPLSDLFLTKLTIYLTYHYFIYSDVYIRLLDQIRPDVVAVMGRSWHELTAVFVSQDRLFPTVEINWFSLSWLQKLIQSFLLEREYSQKIASFKNRPKQISIKGLNNLILLSADFSRHLKTLMPLYRKLEDRGEKPYLVTDLVNLSTTRAGPLSAYFPGKKIVSIKPDLKKLKLPNTTLKNWLINLSLEAAGPMIAESLTLSQMYLQSAENLFQETNPKGVVVISDVRLTELALTRVAKLKKVPSILVSPNTMLDLAGINPYQSAEKVAVVGNNIKKQLLGIGLSRESIRVFGPVAAENWQSSSDRAVKTKVMNSLRIPRGKKLVLAVSFRPTWMIPKSEKETFIRWAVKAVEKNDQILIIKPHPTEKRYRVLEELKDWGLSRVIVTDNNQLDLYELLTASELVLQTWSLTIFEAIMFNRPVIVVNPFKKNYAKILPIIKMGGAKEVKTLSDLIYWLKIFSNHRSQKTQQQLLQAKIASRQFIHSSSADSAGQVIDWFLGRVDKSKGGRR